MRFRPSGEGADALRRVLPWLAALGVFSGLAAVTFSATLWTRARDWFPWMLQPLYHDWHVVRLGWLAAAAGVDPLAAPDHPYNYPRLLLHGADLGLQHLPAGLFGLTAAAAVLGALAFLLSRGGWIAAAGGAVLLLSPPVLLLLERGNLDAWAVVLLALGLCALTREGRPGAQAAGVALVLLAAILKLYPAVVLVGGLFAWRGTRRRWLALTLVLLAVAWLANRAELALIFQKTGRGLEASYGWAIVGSRYLLDAAPLNSPAGEHGQRLAPLMHAGLALYVVLLAGAAAAGWKLRRRCAAGPADPLACAAFWTGGLIYAGTFGLGANWSYRLVFLVFCLPWLGAALRLPGIRPWVGITLGLIFLTMLAPFHLAPGWFYLVQAGEWLLAALLLGGVVAVLSRRPTESKAPGG